MLVEVVSIKNEDAAVALPAAHLVDYQRVVHLSYFIGPHLFAVHNCGVLRCFWLFHLNDRVVVAVEQKQSATGKGLNVGRVGIGCEGLEELVGCGVVHRYGGAILSDIGLGREVVEGGGEVGKGEGLAGEVAVGQGKGEEI